MPSVNLLVLEQGICSLGIWKLTGVNLEFTANNWIHSQGT